MEHDYKYPIIANNYYDLFGFRPLCNIEKEDLDYAYQERFKYWQAISNRREDRFAALAELSKARKALSNIEDKKRYDDSLKRIVETQLQNIVKPMLKVIYNYCTSIGLTQNEIREFMNNYLAK